MDAHQFVGQGLIGYGVKGFGLDPFRFIGLSLNLLTRQGFDQLRPDEPLQGAALSLDDAQLRFEQGKLLLILASDIGDIA